MAENNIIISRFKSGLAGCFCLRVFHEFARPMLSKVAATEGLTKVEESPSEFAHMGVSRRP